MPLLTAEKMIKYKLGGKPYENLKEAIELAEKLNLNIENAIAMLLGLGLIVVSYSLKSRNAIDKR